MLIDLRYHLITLVAVFLALAVGILAGSSFIAGSSVKSLEQEFAKLRAENRAQRELVEDLREQLKYRSEFESAAAPVLVNNRLLWRRVAIIQTGDYSEATQSAKSILEEAGANVLSVTTLANLDAPSARARVVRAVELITGETDVADPVGRALEVVADSVATGSDLEALEILESKGLLSSAGDYDRRVLYVVLIGGDRRKGSKRAQRVDLPLIDELKAAGVTTIVGAEPVDAATSYIPVYHRKAIPTVDDVDLPMGRVALVFAVLDGSGNFGVKKSADQVAPDFSEIGQWR